jgi:hypothetical protein
MSCALRTTNLTASSLINFVASSWNVIAVNFGVCESIAIVGVRKLDVSRLRNLFTLKIATSMFAETLENLQHSTRVVPEC